MSLKWQSMCFVYRSTAWLACITPKGRTPVIMIAIKGSTN